MSSIMVLEHGHGRLRGGRAINMTSTSDSVLDVIERQSEVPYYFQLCAVLERRLETGQIERDSRLPSENEMCKEFGISRATVRQALQVLEARGLVYRVANRGVFAGDRNTDHGWLIQGSQGFLENAITHQNRSVTTMVIRSGFAVLPDFACRELRLPEGSEGFELVRLRHLDGKPAVFSTNYIPRAAADYVAQASDVLAGTASLSELMTRSGFPMAGAHRSVRAVLPTAQIAEALEVKKSAPMLQIRSTSWSTGGVRYDMYETYVRTDVVPLEINVSAVSH
ncbi:MAG TPA: GntR family transcriptional regulator [Mycobacterium sp.]